MADWVVLDGSKPISGDDTTQKLVLTCPTDSRVRFLALQTLWLRGISARLPDWYMPMLTSLDISNCTVSWNVDMLSALPTLRSLFMQTSDTTAVLPTMQHLTVLVLVVNAPGLSVCCGRLLEPIECIGYQPALQALLVLLNRDTLVVHAIEVPDKSMADWLSLQPGGLKLSTIEIWANDAYDLSSTLWRECDTLRVRFAGDKSRDIGLQMLSTACAQVRELVISGYLVDEDVIGHLDRVLRDNTILYSLSFVSCAQFGPAVGRFLDSMTTVSSTRSIAISHCDVCDKTCELISTRLPHTFTHVVITDCNVTDCGLGHLFQLLDRPDLASLDCRRNGPISPATAKQIRTYPHAQRRRLRLDPEYEFLTMAGPGDQDITFLTANDVLQLLDADRTIMQSRCAVVEPGKHACCGTLDRPCRLNTMHPVNTICHSCRLFLDETFQFSNGIISPTALFVLKLRSKCAEQQRPECRCAACCCLSRVGRLISHDLVPRVSFVPNFYQVPSLCVLPEYPADKERPSKLSVPALPDIACEIETVRARGCPVPHCTHGRMLATVGTCDACFAFLSEHASRLIDSKSVHPHHGPTLFATFTASLLVNDEQKMRFRAALMVAQHHLNRLAPARLAFGAPRMISIALTRDKLALPSNLAGLPWDFAEPHADFPSNIRAALDKGPPACIPGDVHVTYRVVEGLLVPVIDSSALRNMLDVWYELRISQFETYNFATGTTNICKLSWPILAQLQEVAKHCINEMQPPLLNLPVMDDQLRFLLVPSLYDTPHEVRLFLGIMSFSDTDKSELRNRFLLAHPFLVDAIHRLNLPLNVMLRKTTWRVHHLAENTVHVVDSVERAAAKVAEVTPCPDLEKFVNTPCVSVQKSSPVCITSPRGATWLEILARPLASHFSAMAALTGELPPKGDADRTQIMLRNDIQTLLAHPNWSMLTQRELPADKLCQSMNAGCEPPLFDFHPNISFLVRAHNGESKPFNMTHWVVLCGHIVSVALPSAPPPFFLLEVVPVYKAQGRSQTTLVLTIPPCELTREDLVQLACITIGKHDDRAHLLKAIQTNSIHGFQTCIGPVLHAADTLSTIQTLEPSSMQWLEEFATCNVPEHARSYVKKQTEALLEHLRASLRYCFKDRLFTLFIELPEHPISIARMLLNSPVFEMPVAGIQFSASQTSCATNSTVCTNDSMLAIVLAPASQNTSALETVVSELVGRLYTKKLACMSRVTATKGDSSKFWDYIDCTMAEIWKEDASRDLRIALEPFRSLNGSLMCAFWTVLLGCRHSPSCHCIDTMTSFAKYEDHALKKLWSAMRMLMGLSFNVSFIVIGCEYRSSVFDASVRSDAWTVYNLFTDPTIFDARFTYTVVINVCRDVNDQLFSALQCLINLQMVFGFLTPVTRLIIYISAHCSVRPGTSECSLTFTEPNPPYKNSFLNTREFTRLMACLGGIYSGRFVILDCCNAAGVLPDLRVSNTQVLEMSSLNERLPLGVMREFVIPLMRSRPNCSKYRAGKCKDCTLFFELAKLHNGYITFDSIAKWLLSHVGELVTFCGRLIRPVYKTNMGPMHFCCSLIGTIDRRTNEYSMQVITQIDELRLFSRLMQVLRTTRDSVVTALSATHSCQIDLNRARMHRLFCRCGLSDLWVSVGQKIAENSIDTLLTFPPNTWATHYGCPAEHWFGAIENDVCKRILSTWHYIDQKLVVPMIPVEEMLTCCGLALLVPIVVTDLCWTSPYMVRAGLTLLRGHPEYRAALVTALLRRDHAREAVTLFDMVVQGTHSLALVISISPQQSRSAVHNLFARDHCIDISVLGWSDLQIIIACAATVFRPTSCKVFVSADTQFITCYVLPHKNDTVPISVFLDMLECICTDTTVLLLGCRQPDELIRSIPIFHGLIVVAVAKCDQSIPDDKYICTQLVEPILNGTIRPTNGVVTLSDVIRGDAVRLLACRGGNLSTPLYHAPSESVDVNPYVWLVLDQNHAYSDYRQACIDVVALIPSNAFMHVLNEDFTVWVQRVPMPRHENIAQHQRVCEFLVALYAKLRIELGPH